MRRYDLVVFDWDGTLLDSTDTIAACLQAACRDLGLPEPTLEAARHVIGLGVKDSLAIVAPSLPVTDYKRLSLRYREHFMRQDTELGLFAGAEALVSRLHAAAFRLAIATGKSRAGLDRSLQRTGLTGLFHATRCADETHPKPHPAMLLELTTMLGVDIGRTLMVGDTTHDLQMARSAGADAVAVGYGAHAADVLEAAGPRAVLDSIAELETWLMQHA